MKLSIQVASTSQTVNVFIQDSSSTTGAGLTGLVFNSGSLTAYYMLPRAAAVSITLATLAAVTSAYSSGGFKEIDATNAPGWYRLDIPDAAIASGRFVGIHLKGATNMAPLPLEIELTAWNNQDAVRGGLTSLPNAAAEAAGGLYTRGSGAGQIAQQANGQIDINISTIKTQTVTCAAGVTVLASVGTAVTSTAQTGDSFARIGFAGVNLSNITPLDSSGVTTLVGTRIPGVIQPQTGDSFARIGALGVGLTAVTIATNNDKTGYSLLAGQLTIKKNTQITITFPMTDATTHLPKTGLTVTAQRTIDGAAVGACANAPTELSGGLYTLVLAATDVNGTMISLALSSAGADTRWIGFVTQS